MSPLRIGLRSLPPIAALRHALPVVLPEVYCAPMRFCPIHHRSITASQNRHKSHEPNGSTMRFPHGQ